MALVSEEIRAEIERLTEDPIIQEMAEEVRPAWEVGAVDLESWEVIRREIYRESGGEDARTIGGPAKAIQRLLEEG